MAEKPVSFIAMYYFYPRCILLCICFRDNRKGICCFSDVINDKNFFYEI